MQTIEDLYFYFQGIILFQVAFFGMLYLITLRKEIIYYCLFILFGAFYFFWNAPGTFFRISESQFFETDIYVNINIFFVLAGNLFYLKFIQEIFPTNTKYYKLLFNISFASLPVLFLCFITFPLLGISRTIIFYTSNLISIPIGLFIVYQNWKSRSLYKLLVSYGILCNIAGICLTVFWISRYNKGIRVISLDEFPLFFLRIGMLADIFFYQLAILRRWYDQEKEFLTNELNSKLEMANIKNEIFRELHDEIGTTLSKINLQSYMAGKKLSSAGFDAKPVFSAIHESAVEMTEKIQNMLNEGSTIHEDIKLYDDIEKYAITMCATKNINLNVSGVSFSELHLSAKQKYELHLVCKEAINNAVKYSHCANLKILFEPSGANQLISIKDDGIGFDTNVFRYGKGIKNMKYRTDMVGGELKIISEINLGTEIRILV
ncbi:MAG: hypothetical protein IPN29_07260 [Saprospiraceae bacterium]|nr:hypothetical protein [Saprospiraceae bacterium]